jgi:hypothetical protein
LPLFITFSVPILLFPFDFLPFLSSSFLSSRFDNAGQMTGGQDPHKDAGRNSYHMLKKGRKEGLERSRELLTTKER